MNAIIDFAQGEPGRRARPLLAVEGRHVMAGHAGGLVPVHPNVVGRTVVRRVLKSVSGPR